MDSRVLTKLPSGSKRFDILRKMLWSSIWLQDILNCCPAMYTILWASSTILCLTFHSWVFTYWNDRQLASQGSSPPLQNRVDLYSESNLLLNLKCTSFGWDERCYQLYDLFLASTVHGALTLLCTSTELDLGNYIIIGGYHSYKFSIHTFKLL